MSSEVSLARLIPLILFSGFLMSITLTGTVAGASTTSPIKHLVIIFQENVSFDHYFATYPHATNGVNGSKFVGDPHTPSINGLSAALLFDNPNSADPFRLDPFQQRSCDITHSYTGEQKEYNGGLMNKFIQFSFPLFSFNPNDSGKCNLGRGTLLTRQ